jgi:excisionase family DNA binding protein
VPQEATVTETQVVPKNREERRHPERAGLLDYDGAAERICTTPRHVRKLVEERQIDSVKVGALVRLEPAAIDEYIARRRRPAV